MGISYRNLSQTAQTYKPKASNRDDKARNSAAFRKYREATVSDARAAAIRESGLPKDWRSRILK